MAQVKHTGKIVVTQPDAIGASAGHRHQLHPERTYLITGGLGALGLQVATALVQRGARTLLLIGRSAPTPVAAQAIAEMEALGARVVVAQADVAERGELAAALHDIGRSLPPLAGVIHAAGRLDDGLIIDQSAARFDGVLAPKAYGAWNLHDLTKGWPLDFFVLFSSAASVLGSPGQSSYAAANAFLDGLAHERVAQGLPALSINWGPWSGAGMAATSATRRGNKQAVQGLDAMTPASALHLLEQLLQGASGQVAVLSADWARLSDQYAGSTPSLLIDLLTERSGAAGKVSRPPELVERLLQAPAQKRRALLLDHVRHEVARVLGLESPATLDRHRGLTDLGMDSLMAVELRARLQASTGHGLSATLAFEQPNIQAIADYLADILLPEEPAVVRVDDVETTHIPDSVREIDLEQLSENEMAALLSSKLASIGGEAA
jgi:short-subunit dehydrogenase/acyl carrier protein